MLSSSAKEHDKERLKATINHAQEGGRRLKKDAQDTVDQLHGDLNSMAHSLGEHVRDFVENASEGLTHAKESIVGAGDTGVAQIRQNPLLATAIALGTGFLLGAFLWRR